MKKLIEKMANFWKNGKCQFYGVIIINIEYLKKNSEKKKEKWWEECNGVMKNIG